MEVRMASEARRFTWLIDVLYDRRVKLVMMADVEPEGLYTEGPMLHEFREQRPGFVKCNRVLFRP
jgi:cell division protein ZapE